MQPRTATVNLANRVGPPLEIVHISDTHNRNDYELPQPTNYQGSILVHSGDWTNGGSEAEHKHFGHWIKNLQKQFQIIIIVSGNHERGFDRLNLQQQNELILSGCEILEPRSPSEDLYGQSGCIILHDRGITVGGLKIYGTPWGLCGPAYCLANNDELRNAHFCQIPNGTHLLITHNPPWLIADIAWVRHKTVPGPCKFCGDRHPSYEHWGDGILLNHMKRIEVPIFFCGHVHDDAMLKVHKIDTLQQKATSGRPHFNCLISNAAMDIRKKSNVIRISGNTAAAKQQGQEQGQQETVSNKEVIKNNNLKVEQQASLAFDHNNDDDDDENGSMTTADSSYTYSSDFINVVESEKTPSKTSSKAQQQATVAKSQEFEVLSSFVSKPHRITTEFRRQDPKDALTEGFLQLTTASRGLSLDRDWYDKKKELVILWRLLRPRQINQIWRFDVLETSVSPPVVTLMNNVTVPALQVRIACLLPHPDANKKNEFEIGYLRAITAQGNSGIVCLAPSRFTSEQNAALEPSTRWFVAPIPGSIQEFQEQNKNGHVSLVKTIEVVLLSSTNDNNLFVLRSNDINSEEADEQDAVKKDMAKSEMEMVPFSSSSSSTSIPKSDRWVVRME